METQYGYDGGYCGENDIKEDEVYALGGVEPAELGTGCADDGDEHKDSEVAEDREDLVLLNILFLNIVRDVVDILEGVDDFADGGVPLCLVGFCRTAGADAIFVQFCTAYCTIGH